MRVVKPSIPEVVVTQVDHVIAFVNLGSVVNMILIKTRPALNSTAWVVMVSYAGIGASSLVMYSKYDPYSVAYSSRIFS